MLVSSQVIELSLVAIFELSKIHPQPKEIERLSLLFLYTISIVYQSKKNYSELTNLISYVVFDDYSAVTLQEK